MNVASADGADFSRPCLQRGGFRKSHDVMQRWMNGPARIAIRLRIYKYRRIVIRDVTSENLSPQKVLKVR